MIRVTPYPLFSTFRRVVSREGRTGAVVVAHLALFSTFDIGHAQIIRAGAMPIGMQMRLLDDAYEIEGNTAGEILGQLRARGPKSWVRFPYVYSWRYRNRRLPLANGAPSTSCTPIDFEMTFEVTATYPRWTAPPEASPGLLEAWESFSAQMTRIWEQVREGMTRRAAAAVRRAERYEEQCAFIDERLREIVIGIFDRPPPGIDDEPLEGLRWPPEGFGGTPPTSADAPADEPAVRSPSSSPTSSATPPQAPPTRGPPPPRPPRAPPESSGLVAVASTLDEAVADDLAGSASGLVLRLDHEGARQFREAFGTDDASAELDPDAVFVFPAFTEVLLAALAAAMASEDIVDLEAPIARYLPDLAPGLGGTTLSLLMTHRAGLDNAVVPDSVDWSDAFDGLDDRAFFTEPGALYSYSRYSYPLVARVLAAASGTTIGEAIADRILGPLDMDDTRLGPADGSETFDGLPATHTTVDDVASFWSSWLDGDLVGTGPSETARAATSLAGFRGRAFLFGTWHDWVDGRARLSLMCGAPSGGFAAGFQVFPATRTILVFWSRYGSGAPVEPPGAPSALRWPANAVRFTLSRIGQALQVGDDIYTPTRLTAGAAAARSPVRCAEPAVSERRVEAFGPRATSGEWAGRYRNGEWIFDLVDDDGSLATPVDAQADPYPIRHFEGEVYFVEVSGDGPEPVGFPLHLRYDPEGRRYVVIGARTYLHEDDRPGR